MRTSWVVALAVGFILAAPARAQRTASAPGTAHVAELAADENSDGKTQCSEYAPIRIYSNATGDLVVVSFTIHATGECPVNMLIEGRAMPLGSRFSVVRGVAPGLPTRMRVTMKPEARLSVQCAGGGTEGCRFTLSPFTVSTEKGARLTGSGVDEFTVFVPSWRDEDADGKRQCGEHPTREFFVNRGPHDAVVTFTLEVMGDCPVDVATSRPDETSVGIFSPGTQQTITCKVPIFAQLEATCTGTATQDGTCDYRISSVGP